MTRAAPAILLILILIQTSAAAVRNANPANYRSLLSELKPGDILQLEPGTYNRLNIRNLNGSPAAWITIAGPPSGPPAVIAGEYAYNTVEILNCSYLAIENLRIDSRGIPGAFGLSARYREENLTHHIRIEGNTFVGQNGGQQTDAISTKTPTWGWIIRYNRIIGAGTGLYLGDSDGSQPFVAGLIEHNLIQDTIGYNLQIKDQINLPAIPGMPLGPTSTIIRDNVFIKNDQPSPDGDRPNLLVGSFPLTGPGALNMYEIYGNYFFHNHREALLQASGRVSVHDNLFIDGPYQYPAVALRKQNHPLQIAYFYNNTVYTNGNGVLFGSRAAVDDAVVGNLIFAMTPASGPIMRQSNNVTATLDQAPRYVRSPSFDPAADFYPLPGKCQGPPIDLSLFQTDTDYTHDFNGALKAAASGVTFRGAYAGEGANPGWQPQKSIKPPRPPTSHSALEVVWIQPAAAPRGATVKITLTGSNFDPASTVIVSDVGVTSGPVHIDSPTQLTVSLKIAPTASPGPRQISVQTGSTRSNPIRFQVQPRSH